MSGMCPATPSGTRGPAGGSSKTVGMASSWAFLHFQCQRKTAGQKLLLANKERGEKDFIDFCFSIREVMLINMDVNL